MKLLRKPHSWLASLSVFAVILTGCGSNVDPGNRITYKNDSVRDRRDSSEDLANIHETEARAQQRQRETQARANGLNANSSSNQQKPTPAPTKGTGGGKSAGGAFGAMTGANALQTFGTLAVLGLVKTSSGMIFGQEEKPEAEANEADEEGSGEAEENENQNRAPAQEVVVNDAAPTTSNEVASKDDLICFFGSEQNLQNVLNIFNAADTKGVL